MTKPRETVEREKEVKLLHPPCSDILSLAIPTLLSTQRRDELIKVALDI